MLSYMKESEKNSIRAPGDSNASSGKDYFTVAGREQHVRNTTIFVIVMFVMGGVSLGLMVKKSRPQAVIAAQHKTEEAEIEAAISRLTGVRTEMVNRMDDILNKFSEFTNVEQVEVKELAKNPFQLEIAKKATVVNQTKKEIDIVEVLKKQMQAEAKTLDLLSIINAENGYRCVMEDRILNTHDTIKNFRIIEIQERVVTLQWLPANIDMRKLDQTEFIVTLKLAE